MYISKVLNTPSLDNINWDKANTIHINGEFDVNSETDKYIMQMNPTEYAITRQ